MLLSCYFIHTIWNMKKDRVYVTWLWLVKGREQKKKKMTTTICTRLFINLYSIRMNKIFLMHSSGRNIFVLWITYKVFVHCTHVTFISSYTHMRLKEKMYNYFVWLNTCMAQGTKSEILPVNIQISPFVQEKELFFIILLIHYFISIYNKNEKKEKNRIVNIEPKR